MFRKMVFSSGLMLMLLLLCAGTAGAAPEIQVSPVTNVSSKNIQNLPIKVRLIDNLGTNTPFDIHVGVRVPGGSIYELDNQLAPHLLPSDPVLSHPVIKNITIPAGTDTGEVTLLNYPFTGTEPGGTYTVFGAVTETGTYNVLSADTKSGVYTPPANTALPPGMSLSCVGVEHGTGVSYIHVCVNLTNVPGKSWSDFTAHMGSTPVDSYSYTYNSALQTYLTKVCATFTIHQYGTYSGTAGVTTDGGSTALSWDINVTSAGQPCD